MNRSIRMVTAVQVNGVVVSLGMAFLGLIHGCSGSIDPSMLEDSQVTYQRVADVSGVVRNAVTTEPVFGATVKIADRTAISDRSGGFFISEVRAGRQTVTIDADGYQPFNTAVELDAESNAVGPFDIQPEEVDNNDNCAPVCEERECGSDGCGGSCGRCSEDELCGLEVAGRCERVEQNEGYCGDGVINGLEECDGTELGGRSCEGLGGAIACTAGCTVDTSGCTSNRIWSRASTIIDYGSHGASSIAVDADGNVVVAGYYFGTVRFGTEMTSSDGHDDIFITKYDASGTHLWNRSFGGVGDQAYNDYRYANKMVIDGSGNIIITGSFEGTVDFGGGVLSSSGGDNLFLAKLDQDGNHLWSKSFENSTSDYLYKNPSLSVDGSGNIFLSGTYEGSIAFDNNALGTSTTYSTFLVKFDPSGNDLWARDIGATENQVISVDDNGDLLMAGSFSGRLVFFDGLPSDWTLESSGASDLFLAKLSSSGLHLWSKSFDNEAQYRSVITLSVSPSGNPIISGSLNGTVDFGGGQLTSAGGADIFIAKFDPSGSHQWSKRFGDEGSDQHGLDLSTDLSGNVLITGTFDGTVDFGGGQLTSAGGGDIFVTKLDPSGNHDWSMRFGDSESQEGYGIATDGLGNVLVTGTFEGNLDLGGVTFNSWLNTAVFVAKFAP